MEKNFNFNGTNILVLIEDAQSPDVFTRNGLECFAYDVALKCEDDEHCTPFYYTRFFDSHQNFKLGVLLTDADLDRVFECVLNDALAYIQQEDIDEFCDAFFGGSAKVSQVNEAYQKCKEVADWFKNVGIDETDLCNMLNSLNDE